MTDLGPLPTPLVDAVREGRAILFLGAGASYGAMHPTGMKVPDGDRLRDLICDKFLSGEMKSSPLIECSDYAIDSTDLNTFQQFIRDTFIDFKPAQFHELIPSFSWTSIFTTNYDLIVERAFGENPHVAYVKNGQKIDTELKKRANSVLLTKLHGCLNHYTDTEIPLALSSDQYVNVSQNRSMLFNRLLDQASQFPIIFVGYRATDLHIKKIFSELDVLGQRRPRYFYVGPNIIRFQKSYLESRRTTCIDATFENFLTALDSQLSSKLRALKVEIDIDLGPMRKHINVAKPKPSGDLSSFLSTDVDYIHSTMPITDGNKGDFYEGVPLGFYPIVQQLDVRRSKKSDTLLSDVFLRSDDSPAAVELCVIKGAAGSGKSVFLRRLAWEASIEFDCLCLFHKRTGALRFSAISDLCSLTSSRIFLFVDRAAYHVEEIEDVLSKARAGKIPLTIITAERHNEWNARCDRLERYVTFEEELGRLSANEVSQLVLKLRSANALGQMSSKTDAECKDIIEQKLDRQILVALHEATKGKSFEEIVVDEYKRIIPIEAQLLYLDICTFQRLGADLRAGLISRIGGVSFDEFKSRLIRPLENVVFVSKDQYGNDHLYRARHQKIAEIVFDQILPTQKEKFDALLRLMKGMNRDYSPDNDAFETLMHGTTLRTIFSNGDLARELLDAGLRITKNDSFILQQRAVFELQHADGDLDVALQFINRALASPIAQKSKLNTKANIYRRMANQARNEIKKAHYRQEAIDVLNLISGKGTRDLTLGLNIQIDELVDLLRSSADNALAERAIANKIQDVEKSLIAIRSRGDSDAYVLDAEARFRKEVHQDERAFASLKRAYDLNNSIAPISIRLSRVYVDRGLRQAAADTLSETQARNTAKELRFELAKLLSENPELKPGMNAGHLLETSFDVDDEQLMPRLYLMREYWRSKQTEKYRAIQRAMRRIPSPPHVRLRPNLILCQQDQPIVFSGKVSAKEADYAFIASVEGYPDVFLHRSNFEMDGFDSLDVDHSVQFLVGFAKSGATAIVR